MDALNVFVAKYVLYLLIIAAVIVVLLAKRDIKKKLLVLSIIAFPLSYLIAKISGTIFYNPRPFVVEHVKPLFSHAVTNGFPSDHTLLGMTIAAVLFTYKKSVGIVFAIVALCIGFARVLSHVHHTVDILGSCVIAICATYIALQLVKRIKILSRYYN